MGNGIIPGDHDLYLGTFGQPFDDYIDKALQEADIIVAIGFDPIEVSPSKLAETGQPDVVHIADLAALADVGWALKADVSGNVADTLPALSAALGSQQWEVPVSVRDVQKLLEKEQTRTPEARDGTFLPEDVLHIVARDLDPDDTVVSGVGTHKLKVARSLNAKRPGQIIIANGSAGMGIALPGAIAAAAMQKDGRTLAICGDGEFLINLQEAETAARLGLSLTVLLWEDGGYGLIEEKQETAKGAHTDLSFENPDWASLCAAFGWDHLPVTTADALREALAQTRKTQKPALITLKVDYSEGLEPNQ